MDVEALLGRGDSGDLGEDLSDLFVALGEAAAEHETGVVFLLDEVQFLARARARGADSCAAPGIPT